jgi:signal transduction protein with GAF and PtsI domain
MKAFTDRLAGSERAYIQELVMDVHDVGTRLLRHLSLDKSALQKTVESVFSDRITGFTG